MVRVEILAVLFLVRFSARVKDCQKLFFQGLASKIFPSSGLKLMKQ
jgi:hypothetical protein